MSSMNAFSQYSLEVSEKWTELNQKLTNRTEVALKLVKQLQTSNKIEKEGLKSTLLYANELKRICENNILNIDNIVLTEQANIKLTESLLQNLVELEFDSKLRNKEHTQFIIDQLSVIEQQICIATNKYNKSCIKFKKEELLFNLKCENDSTEVDFK